MWLPEQERRLLRIFYGVTCGGLKKGDSTPTAEKCYPLEDLVNIFAAKDFKKAERGLKGDCNKPVKKTDDEDSVEAIKKFFKDMAAIRATNTALVERNLINLSPRNDNLRIYVSMTIEGYDLGRKYSQWFTRTGLLFSEYRNHWIWFIVAFFGWHTGSIDC